MNNQHSAQSPVIEVEGWRMSCVDVVPSSSAESGMLMLCLGRVDTSDEHSLRAVCRVSTRTMNDQHSAQSPVIEVEGWTMACVDVVL